ncbi:MAG TPA: hypothetical protein VFC44_07050 [Candidatus Saccharimonadales bacterium]|nr:hypothetical protein [Candidatus Saccharimonadales bacterium]
MAFLKFFRKNKQSASGVMLGLILALLTLSAVPALHAMVHPDAAEPGHQCAVTLFSHGQVDVSSTVAPFVSAPAPLIFRQSLPGVVFVSVDLRLLPSRGPPASSVLA